MSQSKRILYVMHEYPVTTQTFVENEASSLEQLGYRVTRYPLRRTVGRLSTPDVVSLGTVLLSPRRWLRLIVTLGALARNWKPIYRVIRAERLHPRDVSRQFYALAHAVALATYVRSEKDVVHFVHAHFLGRCLDVATFMKILDTRRSREFSATGHAGDVTNPGTPKRLRAQMQIIDGVVCASKAVAAALERQTSRQATGVVHCGIQPVQRAARIDRSGPIRILSVGRLVEKKGFRDAVAAATQMAEVGRDFEWRIIGAGPLEDELLASSQELIDSGKLSWMGALPSSEVLNLLHTWADIFVLPCRTASDGDEDGIPVALMEAMTAGVPVVSGRVAGIPELIASSETGYLIEPGDVQGLVECITVLMDNPNERTRTAQAGKDFVDVEFSLELEAKKMAGLLFRFGPGDGSQRVSGNLMGEEA